VFGRGDVEVIGSSRLQCGAHERRWALGLNLDFAIRRLRYSDILINLEGLLFGGKFKVSVGRAVLTAACLYQKDERA
jgi:hypothetical protein